MGRSNLNQDFALDVGIYEWSLYSKRN